VKTGSTGTEFTAQATAEGAPQGPSDALLVARLAGAGAGPAASVGAGAQPMSAPFRAPEARAAVAGSVAPAGHGVALRWAAGAGSSLDGDGPDAQGPSGMTLRADRPSGPAHAGELSEAALAAFVQLGQHGTGTLPLTPRCPVAEQGALGDGEVTGGLLGAGLAGAEPVLLALLAAHGGVPEREPKTRKLLRRWEG
jgi:hypothetical protein